MLNLTWRNWLQRLSRSSRCGGRLPSRAAAPMRLELVRLEDRTLPSISVVQNFPDINYYQTSCG